jgi:hypothetical protein
LNWFGRSVLKPLEPLQAEGVGDLIRITFINQTFDFIRSEDLTWRRLRYEVSLLMCCSPRELEFVASDIDLALAVKLGVADPAASLSRVSQIHLRFPCHAGSEDGKMKGIDKD